MHASVHLTKDYQSCFAAIMMRHTACQKYLCGPLAAASTGPSNTAAIYIECRMLKSCCRHLCSTPPTHCSVQQCSMLLSKRLHGDTTRTKFCCARPWCQAGQQLPRLARATRSTSNHAATSRRLVLLWQRCQTGLHAIAAL